MEPSLSCCLPSLLFFIIFHGLLWTSCLSMSRLGMKARTVICAGIQFFYTTAKEALYFSSSAVWTALPDEIWLSIIEEVAYLLPIYPRAINQFFSFALVSKKWQRFSRQVLQKCFMNSNIMTTQSYPNF